MRRSSACLLVVLALGCGEDGPPPSLVADVGILQLIVDRDPAIGELEIVDRVVDEERPVHAARLLRTGAIPAAETQVEIVEGLSLRTPEGSAFALRLVAAYRARVTALGTYREMLEGGVGVDPMETLDAIRARREAEELLLPIVSEMTAIAPPTPVPAPDEAEEPEGPGAGSGHPSD